MVSRGEGPGVARRRSLGALTRAAIALTAITLAACGRAAKPARAVIVAPPPTAIEASAEAAPPPPLPRASAPVLACREPERPVDGAQALPSDAELACREGDRSACHAVGSATMAPGCRAVLLRDACDGDVAAACLDLALEPAGDATSTVALSRLLARACELGSGRGCREHAAHLDPGDERHEPLARGCMLGDGASCRLSAAATTDDAAAATSLDSACRHGDALGCRMLGERHFAGRGVATDAAHGRALLLRACMLDDASDGGEACRELAAQNALFGGQTDAPDRSALLERGCTKGSVDSCRALASERYGAGLYEGALGPAARLAALAPEDWFGPYLHGMSLYNLGRFDEAVGVLERLCELRSEWPYCKLWLYLARERSARDGKLELARTTASLDSSAWPGPVAAFFLGRISEAVLIGRARRGDGRQQLEQACEAHYYVGARHMAHGRAKQAARSFELTIATGVTNFVEYAAARAELGRLRAGAAQPKAQPP